MPLGLFLLFSSLYGQDTQDGISGKAWLMVSMSVFGAMGAAVSIGGRIAGERQAGWTRQLRLTPMPGWAYVVSKAVTALLVAVPALVLVYAVGALAEGVRLPAATWAQAAGWSLLALAPFVALGIWLGHRLTIDVLGPLSGALFTVLGILGGIWFPVDQLPAGLQSVAKALPSYWLAQAGREPLAGSWIGWHGVSILAVWTVAFALLAARAYRRDTTRN
jgi:ABC-2 type transport system permease protein